ncbi:nuclear transport factor 2 family protein [Herbaspirillum rubrisubalbicans]|jgi:hypothetical protein|nr:nuclear transport factor 2 family protein [Herbaspirillum rubrisubalbicans]MCP1576404.1 hypothetical protein [Herbaspirillum rubrisubalbicans]
MTSIQDAIEDMLTNVQLTVEEAIARHFVPSFRQRVNGAWLDQAGFEARIAALRQMVDSVTITVLDEFFDSDRYAERHIIDIQKRDGDRIRQEVYLFAQRSQDGRFIRIEETTLTI